MEKRRNQNELFQQQLTKERQKMEAQATTDRQKLEAALQQQIRKSVSQDYELGLVKQLSMRTHLGLDLASGVLLAASPWLFGFSDYVTTPHLVLGILEIGASLMTKTEPTTATVASMAR